MKLISRQVIILPPIFDITTRNFLDDVATALPQKKHMLGEFCINYLLENISRTTDFPECTTKTFFFWLHLWFQPLYTGIL